MHSVHAFQHMKGHSLSTRFLWFHARIVSNDLGPNLIIQMCSPLSKYLKIKANKRDECWWKTGLRLITFSTNYDLIKIKGFFELTHSCLCNMRKQLDETLNYQIICPTNIITNCMTFKILWETRGVDNSRAGSPFGFSISRNGLSHRFFQPFSSLYLIKITLFYFRRNCMYYNNYYRDDKFDTGRVSHVSGRFIQQRLRVSWQAMMAT